MSKTAAVAEPLIEVRDVLETYRRHHVAAPGWSDVLSRAASNLDQLPAGLVMRDSTSWIATEIRGMIAHGLQYDEVKLDMVAQRTAEILDRIRVPGIPRPEDDNWEFS